MSGPTKAHAPGGWPSETTVDVWLARVDLLPSDTLADADAILDEQESARARSFRFDIDARRYVAAHVLLRRLLGDHLGVPAGAVGLTARACVHCAEPHGKPSLDLPGREFSLSHAGDLVAVALATHPVGVDVEVVGGATHVADLFHPSERRALETVPPDEVDRAASQCWVRKEAYVKATGAGLGDDGVSVPVGLGSGGAPGTADGRVVLGGFAVTDLVVPAGYTGAVAAAPATTVRTYWVTS